MSDSAFAEQLLAHPEQTLMSFDLTMAELNTFKTMSRAAFEFVTSEECKSFGFGVLQKSG